MSRSIDRREFLASAAPAALALSAGALARPSEPAAARVGFIGVGGRGTGLLRTILNLEEVTVPAVCDIDAAAAERARAIVAAAGRKAPETYTRGPTDFERLDEREDLDAVIIATPWEWHARMAVHAMRCGKVPGVEVPIAQSVAECWELVDTSEQTGIPCMMLENWSFRRDNLAVLRMIRKGLLGEIVHCHCAHSHNCLYWYFNPDGSPRWSGEWLIRRDCDQYPTHSLGPVLSWMNINCGDRLARAVSMSSRSLGINDQLARLHGSESEPARRRYAQGDIVTTMVETARGNTLVIANDMQLPRPYDNRWLIQGTRGLYNEQREAVYLEGTSPAHEQWEPFPPYQEKFEHRWWKEQAAGGHGGTDAIELREFVRAVRSGGATPIDVYDSVTMSVIVAISRESIARGSQPVEIPDFTRGKWQHTAPKFALDT